jgi:hypothetical protein
MNRNFGNEGFMPLQFELIPVRICNNDMGKPVFSLLILIRLSYKFVMPVVKEMTTNSEN